MTNNNNTSSRYQPFLLEKELPFSEDGQEGLNMVDNHISTEEAQKNVESIRFLEGVYFTLTALFDAHEVTMGATGFSICFYIPQKGFNHYDHCGPEIRSPQLDRHKLKNATPEEIVDALTDLFLERKNWSHHVVSNKLDL